jgi:cell pole-organizing protein PopZ
MVVMAGPLTSEEIEDVVSSVRRLVSNEQSPRRLSRDLNAERLLLTPSLRVVSESSPLAPLILDAPMPETVAAVQPERLPVDDPLAATPDDAVDLVEAEWEDELWSPSDVTPLGEVALAADEAEVLLPTAQDLPEAFAPEPEADDLPEAWAEVGPDFAEDEPVAFVPLRRRAESLAAKLAAGEVSDTVVQLSALSDADLARPGSQAVDPTLYEDLAVADLPIAGTMAEDAATDAPGQSADAAARRSPTDLLDADGTQLAVLDEAALQEIVRQMIRDELQGTLGERITRNVRKLVRAEINRALMARDLD